MLLDHIYIPQNDVTRKIQKVNILMYILTCDNIESEKCFLFFLDKDLVPKHPQTLAY